MAASRAAVSVIGPLDLDWARAGYLRLPNGRLRHLIGLDVLAGDMILAGAHPYWADLPGTHAGYCDCQAGTIYLAPWLFLAWPCFVKSVVAHELAHVIVGCSCARARSWQERSYGDMLAPAWA